MKFAFQFPQYIIHTLSSFFNPLLPTISFTFASNMALKLRKQRCLIRTSSFSHCKIYQFIKNVTLSSLFCLLSLLTLNRNSSISALALVPVAWSHILFFQLSFFPPASALHLSTGSLSSHICSSDSHAKLPTLTPFPCIPCSLHN